MQRRLAGLVIFGWLIAAGLTTAGVVRADPITRDALDYATTHTQLICSDIAAAPSVDNLDSVLSKVQFIGDFTAYQSGQIVGAAVQMACPEYLPVLRLYAHIYGGTNT